MVNVVAIAISWQSTRADTPIRPYALTALLFIAVRVGGYVDPPLRRWRRCQFVVFGSCRVGARVSPGPEGLIGPALLDLVILAAQLQVVLEVARQAGGILGHQAAVGR